MLERQFSTESAQSDILDLTSRSFRRRRCLLSQKSEPAGFSELAYLDEGEKAFTGHEEFAVSYSNYIKIPREPPSPGTHILGRVFSFSRPERRESAKKRRSLRRMTSTGSRRRASAAPTVVTAQPSTPDVCSPTTACGAYYNPSNAAQPTPSALLGCHSARSVDNCSATQPNRLKAVITVDPETTKILIANDHLSRLFGLNQNTLIGQKLTDVFTDKQNATAKRKVSFPSLDEDNQGPTIVDNALFDEEGKLKPVYGKPVDIIDKNGHFSTVCLWSYPLNAPSANKGPRKGSVMLLRSPSALLPGNNTTLSGSNSLGVGLRVTTSALQSTPLNSQHASPAEAESESAKSPLSGSKPRLPKDGFSPFLKVLHEEDSSSSDRQLSQDAGSLIAEANAGAPQPPAARRRTPDPWRPTRAVPSAPEPETRASHESRAEAGPPRHPRPHAAVQQPAPQRRPLQHQQQPLAQPAGGHPLSARMVVDAGDLHAAPADDEDDKGVGVQRTLKAFRFVYPDSDDESQQQQPPQPAHSSRFSSGGGESRSRRSTRGSNCPLVNGQMNEGSEDLSLTPLNPHHNAEHTQQHVCNSAENCRWLILMEPVNALHISVILGAKGRIFRADDSLAAVLGYDCTNRLFGTELTRLIPSLDTSVTANGIEQNCCGCSVKKNGVPLSAVVVVEFDKDQNPLSYDVRIRSLASINGVVTITENGVVYSVNENFLGQLTGRKKANEGDVMLVTDLIPGFYDANTVASLSAEHPVGACVTVDPAEHTRASVSTLSSANSAHEDFKRFNSLPQVQVGSFYGLAQHQNGVLIPVRFDVTNLDMQGQPRLYAVGIGFERGIDYGLNQQDPEEQEQMAASMALRRSSSSGNESDFEIKTFPLKDDDDQDQALEIKIHNVHLSALADESNEAVCGEYSAFYETFQLIGNGTFGSVKLAARKDTGLLAVTKFVCKAKVLPESWVESPHRATKVPIEVHLLESLDHQNIVKVLDVFENKLYYQLVMEKLGCGMDLFEFIENHPQMDERLTSYIFRQIVAAVKYLHDNHIVHRDLKDENVIIDRNFTCKLIDFGSAAYFGPDIVFSTFCGTMEYCSPEVLSGNKYLGPEVEMWSLGILLYTLVFFQNPFRTPHETIHAEIELIWDVSEGLYQVIAWLLTPDPKERATVADIEKHWWVTQQVDPTQYKFKEVLKDSDRARVSPPLYVSDLHNHLKNTASCGNLASAQVPSIDAPPRQESGVVSAR